MRRSGRLRRWVTVAVALCCPAAGCLDTAAAEPTPTPSTTAAAPAAQLAVGAGVPGRPVGVDGIGWCAGDVHLYLDASPSTDTVAQAAADGAFAADVAIPLSIAYGTHQINAREQCGAVIVRIAAPAAGRLAADKSVIVAPTLRVDPDRARAGTTVTASGAGWNPEFGSVDIVRSHGPAQSAKPLRAASPRPDGSFDVQVRVPPEPRGRKSMYAFQPGESTRTGVRIPREPTFVSAPFTSLAALSTPSASDPPATSAASAPRLATTGGRGHVALWVLLAGVAVVCLALGLVRRLRGRRRGADQARIATRTRERAPPQASTLERQHVPHHEISLATRTPTPSSWTEEQA